MGKTADIAHHPDWQRSSLAIVSLQYYIDLPNGDRLWLYLWEVLGPWDREECSLAVNGWRESVSPLTGRVLLLMSQEEVQAWFETRRVR